MIKALWVHPLDILTKSSSELLLGLDKDFKAERVTAFFFPLLKAQVLENRGHEGRNSLSWEDRLWGQADLGSEPSYTIAGRVVGASYLVSVGLSFLMSEIREKWHLVTEWL